MLFAPLRHYGNRFAHGGSRQTAFDLRKPYVTGKLDAHSNNRFTAAFGLFEFLATGQTKIPTPAEVLGFTPGDDRKLASWNQVIEYFEQLDRASDRVIFETLGQTSMDKPFVMATISSPANLARLEEYKQIQDQLADPRKLGRSPHAIAKQQI